MYSTFHHSSATDTASGKPIIISDYNKTKWAVDIFDKMQGMYAYDYGTRRWPLKLFMFIVNCCAMNAYSLMKPSFSRRAFLNALSDQLAIDQKKTRQDSQHYTTNAFQQISVMFDELHTKVRGMGI